MNKTTYSIFSVVFLACLLSCICSAELFAQHQEHEHAVTQTTGEPETEGAKILSKFTFKPLNFTPPKVDRLVLENGMIVYLLEDHELPIFHITARIRTGAIYEPEEKAGLASLTGYVMRSGGTLSMPSDKMNKELEFIAASVETSIDREQGNASLSVLKKDIDKGLNIFADVLMNPAFPENKIKMRKDEVLESIRRENDDPITISYREFRKILYDGKHPYSRRVDGTIKSINTITRDDLVSFHKKYFKPNNIILGLSGDFERAEILKKLNSIFADWKKENIVFPDVPAVKREYKRSVNYVYKDVNQASVVLGHLGIRRTNPDYFPVKLMNFILGGGGFSARITSRIRSDEGLAYSAYSDFQTSRDIGIFYVSCQTKLASTNRAISIALEEIENMRNAPVTEKELNHAKETIVNQFVFRFTTSSSIVSQKVDIEYDGLPLDYLETYVENVQSITLKEIERVAKKYLHPDDIKILVVGNKDKFDKQLDSFGKVNVIELQ